MGQRDGGAGPQRRNRRQLDRLESVRRREQMAVNRHRGPLIDRRRLAEWVAPILRDDVRRTASSPPADA